MLGLLIFAILEIGLNILLIYKGEYWGLLNSIPLLIFSFYSLYDYFTRGDM